MRLQQSFSMLLGLGGVMLVPAMASAQAGPSDDQAEPAMEVAPEQAQPQEAGSQQAGPQQAGPQQTGPGETKTITRQGETTTTVTEPGKTTTTKRDVQGRVMTKTMPARPG